MRLPRGPTTMARGKRRGMGSNVDDHSSCVNEEVIHIVPLTLSVQGNDDVPKTAADPMDTVSVNISSSYRGVNSSFLFI